MVKICSNYSNDEKYQEYFNGFPYKLNDFQKHSIEALVNGHHSLVTAATGCGKSTCFQFAAEYFTKLGKKIIYCSPVKSLSNQMYYNLIRKYPHISVGILTGDFKINPEASVLIVTTEILSNTLFVKKYKSQSSVLSFDMDFDNDLACVVFDEFHYINDRDRGTVWENSIMMLPSHIQLLMLSATLDKPDKIAKWIENRYDDSKEVYISSTIKRAVPLTHYNFITTTQSIFKTIGKNEELKNQVNNMINRLQVIQTSDGVFNDSNYHKMTKVLDLLEDKKVYMKPAFVINQAVKYMSDNKMLPAICFILSRKQIDKVALEINIPIMEDDMIVRDIKREAESILRKKLPNFQEYLELPEYIELISLLEKGVGKHHAGMITILREIVELFLEKGYIKLLLTTETFAIGVNFAIKTVLFTDINKFDGNMNRILLGHEFTQMSGRAGRLGIDTVGNVIHLNNLFRNVNLVDYKNMMKGTPQVLFSKFKISYNLLLNLIESNPRELLKYCKNSMIQNDIDTDLNILSQHMKELEKNVSKLETLVELSRTPLDILSRYVILKNEISINKKQKDRDIASLIDTNKFIEPDYTLYLKYKETCKTLENIREKYNNTFNYVNDTIQIILDFLEKESFIQKNQGYELTSKGIIATQLREVHCLVLANMLEDENFLSLSAIELVSIFSCFTNIVVADEIKTIKPKHNINILDKINLMYDSYSNFETRVQADTGIDYSIHYDLMDLMNRWCKCTNSEECKSLIRLAEEINIPLGEFIKAIMKINCIASEMERININVDFLSKLKEIPLLTQKYVVINQSLYI